MSFKWKQNNRPQKGLLDSLYIWCGTINIYILVITPIVTALFLLGILSLIGERVFGSDVPEVYYAVSGLIFLIFVSISGVVQILRREGPGPWGNPVFGAWPVINGCIIVLICALGILYLLSRILILIRM